MNVFLARLMKILFGFILLLAAAIGLAGYFSPVKHTQETSVTIQAPRFLIEDYVSYWKNWPLWSSWTEKDPNYRTWIKGVDGQLGSVFRWKGNSNKSGEGAMVLTNSNKYEISFSLLFINPPRGQAEGFVRMRGAGNTTIVTRGFIGFTPFPWNVLMLFKKLEKLREEDYNLSLDKLRALAEKDFKAVQQYKVMRLDYKGGEYAVIRQKIKLEEVDTFLERSFEKITRTINSKRRVRKNGLPSALFFNVDKFDDIVDIAAAVPVNRPLKSTAVDMINLEPSVSFQVDYSAHGSNSDYAHKALSLYFNQNGLFQTPHFMETYLVNRALESDTAKWQTRVIYFTE